MGLDEKTAADVAEGATTPAPAEPAVSEPSTETTKAPDISGDPWEDFGKEKIEEKIEEKSETPDGKEEEKKEGEEEPDLEDQIVKEAFGDEKPDEKADEKKPDEGKETEEDVDKKDPKEMIAAQRNASAKAWAERAEKVYKPTVDFKYGNLPVAEFHDRLSDFIGEEKAGEFASYEAHRLVDDNPEGAFHRIFAIKMLAKDPNWEYSPDKVPSLDDLVSGKVTTAKAEEEPKTVATAYDVPAGELEEQVKNLDSVIDWDWRDPKLDDQFVDEREKAMAQTLRVLEAKAKTATSKETELTKQLSDLSKQVEGLTNTQQTEGQKKLKAETDILVGEFKKSIEDKMIPQIAKRTGLEISKDDTPEVAAFKTRKMQLYTGDAYEKANGFSSRFETFAFEESSVKQDLVQASENFINLKVKEALARLEDKPAEAKKHHDEAEGFKITFFKLFGVADKEFAKQFIEPDITLLGLKAKAIAEPIIEAAKRRETVSTGGGVTTTKRPERQHETADDIWNAMPGEAAEEEREAQAA